MFGYPMDEHELLSYMSSSCRKKYKFTDKYLIDILDISPEEQDALHIGNSRKAEYAAKREQKGQRNQRILALKEEGYTQAEIAKICGCSQPTVCRVLKNAVQEDTVQETAVQEDTVQEDTVQEDTVQETTGVEVCKNPPAAPQAQGNPVPAGKAIYSFLHYIIILYGTACGNSAP